MEPISDKQLAANRANAARSTGPRTRQGKARSSRNARKHSFSSEAFAIIKIEDSDAVNHLREDLIAVFQPVNSQEIFAVERIALAQHNLLRIARLEAGLGTAALNQAISAFDGTPFIPLHDELDVAPEQVTEQNRAYAFAQGFHSMNRQSATTWSLFLRYQTQAERLYRRAVEDFERLTKLRPHLPQPMPDDDSPNEAISGAQLEENSNGSASENEAISDPVAEPSATPNQCVNATCSLPARSEAPDSRCDPALTQDAARTEHSPVDTT